MTLYSSRYRLFHTNPPYNEETEFSIFLKDFRPEKCGHFIYRDQIRRNITMGCLEVNIDLSHLAAWDPLLEDRLLKKPEKVMVNLKRAANKIGQLVSKREVQLQINLTKRLWSASSLRELSVQSTRVGELVKVEGIIVSCKKPGVKFKTIELRCRGCGHQISLDITGY